MNIPGPGLASILLDPEYWRAVRERAGSFPQDYAARFRRTVAPQVGMGEATAKLVSEEVSGLGGIGAAGAAGLAGLLFNEEEGDDGPAFTR